MNEPISRWAEKWGVSSAALDDLRASITSTDPAVSTEGSEAGVLSRVRLEASQKGIRLFRNNIGAATDERGHYVRFGLCNDSPQISKILKSSDLIGIRPVRLPDGGLIGQFVAREIKKPGWKYTGAGREKAQLNFLQLIKSFGGDACFATGEGTI